ncbi:hypothetical protein CR513_34059, partial [Mucuna pruriens]
MATNVLKININLPLQIILSTPSLQTKCNLKTQNSEPIAYKLYFYLPPTISQTTNLPTQCQPLRAIKKVDCYGFNVIDLCLVPNVVILPKFNLFKFDRYRGDTCLKNHLTMYYRKILSCTHNNKLLIYFFQGNLMGVALSWYMNLEQERVQTWKDLIKASLKQYKYNMDMAPNQTHL